MAYTPPLITALAVPVAGSVKKGGYGRVEGQIDPTTYTIKIGREVVTVKVTTGSISVGERVAVIERGGKFLIEAIDPEQQGQHRGADAFLPGKTPAAGDLVKTLESVADRIAASGGSSSGIKDAQSLFERIAPELAETDPKLTKNISAAMDRLTRLSGTAPPGDNAPRETEVPTQAIKAQPSDTVTSGSAKTVDAVITRLTTQSFNVTEIKQAEALFSRIAPELAKVNPKLTKDISDSLDTLARSPEKTQARDSAVRETVDNLQTLKSLLGNSADPAVTKTIDAVIGRLSTSSESSQEIKEAAKLFAAVAPKLAEIDPKLTKAVSDSLEAMARLPDKTPPSESTVKETVDNLQKLQAQLGKSADPAVIKTIDAVIGRLSTSSVAFPGIKDTATPLSTSNPEPAEIDPKLTITNSDTLAAVARQPAEPSSRDALVRTILDKLETLKARLIETAPATGRTTILRASVPEGIYAFSTIDEVKQFLETPKGLDRAFTDALSKEIAATGTVTLRVTACGGSSIAVSILLPEEITTSIESLAARFSSRAMQSIPPALFGQLLEMQGELSFDFLNTLDRAADALQIPAATLRAGSTAAQEAALQQWLDAAIKGNADPAVLAARLPVFSASSIIDSLDDLNDSASSAATGGVTVPTAEPFSLTDESIDGDGRDDLLPQLLKRMGLDSESLLALGSAPEKNALKPQLLELAQRFEVASYSPATGNQTSSLADADAQRSAILSKVNDLEATIRTIMSKIGTTGTQEPSAAAPLPPGGSSAPPSAAVSPESKPGDVLTARFTELKQTIEQLAEKSGAAPVGQREADDAPAAMLRNRLNEQINRLQSDVQALAKRLTALSAPGANPQTAPAQPPGPSTASPSVQNAINELMLAIPDLSQKIEDLRPAIARLFGSYAPATGFPGVRAGEPLPGGSSAIDNSAPGAVDDKSQSVAHQTVRQTIETLLTKVESLQLLGRQVETSSGSQQIMALPVRIGSEWTELHVRFIRREGKNGAAQKERNDFAVQLNVAPTILGAIGARLDYSRQKSLRVTMEFESNATREWFAKRKIELRDALIALGLPSPGIEFLGVKGRTVSRSGERTAASAVPSTIIDLKV
jgi:hypothetical protein